MAKRGSKSALRPRNWTAMREDRVLAMAENRFGKSFATKSAAISALSKLPVAEQRGMRKVAVSVAQKAAKTAAASAITKGMSAAGRLALKASAPLAITGFVISALTRPANAQEAIMADKMESEKRPLSDFERAIRAVAGLGALGVTKDLFRVRGAIAKRVASKTLGVFTGVGGASMIADAITGEAAASEGSSDRTNPSKAKTGGGDGNSEGTESSTLRTAADFLTFGVAGLALDAGADTRKQLAEMKEKRDAAVTAEAATGAAIAAGGAAAQVGALKWAGRFNTGRLGLVGALATSAAGTLASVYGVNRAFSAEARVPKIEPTGRAFLNDAAARKSEQASRAPAAQAPASSTGRTAAQPARSDGTTNNYVSTRNGKAVQVAGYKTPTRR